MRRTWRCSSDCGTAGIEGQVPYMGGVLGGGGSEEGLERLAATLQVWILLPVSCPNSATHGLLAMEANRL